MIKTCRQMEFGGEIVTMNLLVKITAEAVTALTTAYHHDAVKYLRNYETEQLLCS